ncbi:MAG: YHS domain-containing protein [Armatimonadetes bacterium]|nr:YHS domain-containing protein [Armatimonadota bacterium]
MKEKIESHANAAGYADFEGTRYYFCCAGCDATFAENPAKYAANVKGSIKSVTPGEAKVNRTMAPTCAGCAGEAKLLGPDGLPATWTFTYRYVNIDDPKAQHRFSLDYAVNPRLYVGIERSGSDNAVMPVPRFQDDPFDYLRKSDGDALILPRFSWFITPEGDNHPSLLVGMASDRLSTPRGQAFFLTASKHIKDTPITPFVSVKTNTWGGRTVFPFGVNVTLPNDMIFQGINDGDYSHFLLTKMANQQAYSLLLARGKHLGFVVSWGF